MGVNSRRHQAKGGFTLCKIATLSQGGHRDRKHLRLELANGLQPDIPYMFLDLEYPHNDAACKVHKEKPAGSNSGLSSHDELT